MPHHLTLMNEGGQHGEGRRAYEVTGTADKWKMSQSQVQGPAIHILISWFCDSVICSGDINTESEPPPIQPQRGEALFDMVNTY